MKNIVDIMNISSEEWYNLIADSYELLYGEEQEKKIQFIEDLFKKLFGNVTFENGLDFGCGTGISTKFLIKITKNAYACEISQNMLEKAKEKLKNVIFINCKELEKYNNFFDIILSVTVLQDVEEPERILELFNKILKDNGILILSVLKKKGIEYWKPKIKKYFNILWFSEEEKDFIFILSKKFY